MKAVEVAIIKWCWHDSSKIYILVPTVESILELDQVVVRIIILLRKGSTPSSGTSSLTWRAMMSILLYFFAVVYCCICIVVSSLSIAAAAVVIIHHHERPSPSPTDHRMCHLRSSPASPQNSKHHSSFINHLPHAPSVASARSSIGRSSAADIIVSSSS